MPHPPTPLYTEGIKERDTLNIKAIVNTHGESAVSSRLSAPTITIFICMCRCVHMHLRAHVRVCDLSRSLTKKRLSALAITYIKQALQRFHTPPPLQKRENSGKERGWNCTSKRSISLSISLSLSRELYVSVCACECVCVSAVGVCGFQHYSGWEKKKRKISLCVATDLPR